MLKQSAKLFPFLILLFFASCTQNEEQKVKSKAYHLLLKQMLKHDVPEIGVREIDSIQDVIFLDTRAENEYNVSSIEGAIFVGYDDFDLSRIGDLPKDARIVSFCSIGYRSEIITRKLQDAGYTNAHNMVGGIFEWVNDGRPVVDSSGQVTNKVHAFSKSWGIWLNKGEKVYK